MKTMLTSRWLPAVVTALAVVLVALLAATGRTAAPPRPTTAPLSLDAAASSQIAAYVPPIRHVFVINIENEDEDNTWGDASAAPYLATTLRAKGVLLENYYGTAHNSEPNYVAQISGQGPNPAMQADCQRYARFQQLSTTAPDQAVGLTGCVFPSSVHTIADQLDAAGLTWRGYMDDMASPCEHPALGSVDETQKATTTAEYATRHDPFMYFGSIIDRPSYCASHVVGLSQLTTDLRQAGTTPNLSYITPDLCDDGHDTPCADGRPGGLTSVDAFMRTWVPRILASPAFTQDGMLVITADESDGPTSDASSCCGETSVNTPLPGITGSGGGRIGALVISKWTTGGTWSTTPYNHYALLASLEEIFRLDKLGYASAPTLDRFGLDVYNSGWNNS